MAHKVCKGRVVKWGHRDHKVYRGHKASVGNVVLQEMMGMMAKMATAALRARKVTREIPEIPAPLDRKAHRANRV